MTAHPADDCCFRPSEQMLSVEDALARIAQTLSTRAERQSVPLSAALGRILAKDIVSPLNVPPHDNSAVDGYAVFHADLSPDDTTRLPLTGRIAAGHPLDRPARRGEALRIFTGAPMPEGPDTVIMQEDSQEDGDHVILQPGVRCGANRRRAGEDVRQGETVLSAGTRLRAQEIGLVASLGLAQLAVYAPLRVAVFSTGDEITNPGDPLTAGAIYDANRFTILALLSGMGCQVTDLGILPDRLEVITAALAEAAQDHHLLITSGGVSLGDEDHVKAAVNQLGVLTFWRLAIKPGRPLALGQVGATPLIGLPGNPVAAMVTFMTIGRAVVLRLAGDSASPPRPFRVIAGFDYDKKAGRREWLRARLEHGAEGPRAIKFASQGSGILMSMVASDGLVVLDEPCTQVRAGQSVEFLPFQWVT